MFANGIHIRCLLEFLVLINTFLDEDALQRLEVQLFLQLAFADFQFLTNEILGAVDRVAQHIADGEKLRLVALDNTAVWRYAHLAIGKGIEGIDGLIARHARSQMNLNLDLGSSKILYLTGLDLTLLDGLYYRVLQSL